MRTQQGMGQIVKDPVGVIEEDRYDFENKARLALISQLLKLGELLIQVALLTNQN